MGQAASGPGRQRPGQRRGCRQGKNSERAGVTRDCPGAMHRRRPASARAPVETAPHAHRLPARYAECNFRARSISGFSRSSRSRFCRPSRTAASLYSLISDTRSRAYRRALVPSSLSGLAGWAAPPQAPSSGAWPAARAAVRCARLIDAWRPRICTASGHEAGVAAGPPTHRRRRTPPVVTPP